MSEYTPSTEEVRAYSNYTAPEFDRWFAEATAEAFRLGYKRGISDVTDADLLNKAKADAWYEGASWAFDGAITVDDGHNPYRGESA